MLSVRDFYGFGSMERYVCFMLHAGCTWLDVTDALKVKMARVVEQCPNIDVYKYPISDRNGGATWSNEECKQLFDHYGENGPDWDGWRDLLPNRTRGAIEGMARRLGIPH